MHWRFAKHGDTARWLRPTPSTKSQDSLADTAANVLGKLSMSDLSFQNNVPDPLLSGKELPTFKFELEKSKGKVIGNSFGKEATAEQLPISRESPVYPCNSNRA